jgi:hypothetical protein
VTYGSSTNRVRLGARGRWLSLAVLGLVAAVVIFARPWRMPVIRRMVLGRAGAGATPDTSCVRCHASIVRSFARHAMGRSLAPIEGAEGPLGEGVRFEAGGLSYGIERRGGTLYHRESLLGPDGHQLASIEEPIRYALGSGTRGVSFLIERGDGYLFQSPISWYSQKQRWDLAPGYDKSNPHFERPIAPECLTCHSNRANAVVGELNHFEPPIFEGHAISCERCHGSGEEHVQARGDVGPDGRPTIVNPGMLEPSLREAVCEQCHLMGETRVDRLGKTLADFRPGAPLDDVVAVFVKPGAGRDPDKSIGHVEQMHASRCYQRSAGELGCISCHDPHEEPGAAQKVAYYRVRCLACHEGSNGCSLPGPERTARRPDDSCTACHMPPAPLSDIAHTAATRHDIPRESKPAGPAPPSASGDDPVLVAFHEPISGGTDDWGRERAIALATKVRGETDPATASRMASEALASLESTLARQPNDPAAWEAKASALFMLGRRPDALDALREALRHQPDREQSLDVASMLATQLRRGDEALDLIRRLIRVNPWMSDYHAREAVVNASMGRWEPAVEAAEEALRLNPASPARQVLVIHGDRTGQPDRARAEREILRAYLSGR